MFFVRPCGFQGKREKPAVEEIEASGVDSFIQKGLESNSYVPGLEVEKFSMNFVCLVTVWAGNFHTNTKVVVAHVKKKSARAKVAWMEYMSIQVGRIGK